MKVEITHACGHKVTHNIVGTNVGGERDRKAAWIADQPCAACKEAARAEANAVAAASNVDMVALTGSAKQVAWAESIRAAARTAVDQLIEGKPLNDAQRAALDALWAQADAGWWIDRRANGAIAIGWIREAAGLAT